VGLAAVLAVAAVAAWNLRRKPDPYEGFGSGNGRIEGVEVQVASKVSGRIQDILVDDGDYVEAGQLVARMDVQALDSSLLEAQARVEGARSARAAAVASVAQRESEVAAATAMVEQRRSERDLLSRRLDRSRRLVQGNSISAQQHDEDTAAAASADAALVVSRAQLSATKAAVDAARARVVETDSTIGAALASVDVIRTAIRDGELTAPRSGRVQFRIVQPGEVIGAGGKILSLLDVSDVYMTFFLPEGEAGRVAIGSEVRLVLDAAPDYVIPATVSYVASVAQFTPKTVETKSERQKLMFRVKARIATEILDVYRAQVKTGLPGVAYVQLDKEAPWPPNLAIRLPRPRT
jgi:HlyD family secretion protein